jgi:hypothetical protein
MLPWLNAFASMKVSKSKEHLTPDDYESVGYIIQTRMMPSPPLTDERFEKEVKKLKDQFVGARTFTDNQRSETRYAVSKLLRYLNNIERFPSPHVSLTTNGCYENPRTGGGRALYVCRKFLERYVQKVPEVEVRDYTWWGAPFVEVPNVQPYKTMCRSTRLDKDIPFLSCAFRSEMASDGLIAAAMAHINSQMPIEEPIFGLDNEFPHQLLQWSVEEAVEKGFLPGPATEWSPLRCTQPEFPLLPRQPVPCDLYMQPEAGNKVRLLAISPACVTITLQPFGHWLEGVIKPYPMLRSAFTRSFKGWDFAVTVMRGDFKAPDNGGFGVFDLTGASNGLNTEFVRTIISLIILDQCDDKREVFFYLKCLDLLLAPRLIRVRRRHTDNQYRVILTGNGLHMGDPGTKEALCLVSAVIECMVQRDVPRPPPAQVAGDDNIGLKTLEQHRLVVAKHREYSNEINESKTQWSDIFVWYCEELLVYREGSIGIGKAPWQVEYAERVHHDVCKMRLLSPFSSVSGDQMDQKNPALGKGDALWEFLQNCRRQKLKDFILYTYKNWMSSFIKDDPLVFLPRVVGGNNVPYGGSRKELYERCMASSPFIATLYYHLRYTTDPPYVLGVITSRMSSGMTTRGVIDKTNSLVVAQYAHIAFNQFRDSARTLDSFLEELRGRKSYEVSYKDALRYARQSGFISYGGIADTLDRITAVRMSLAAAAGAYDLEQILPSKVERLPSPSEVLERFIKDELPQASGHSGLQRGDFVTTPEHVKRFREWVLDGSPNFTSSIKRYWVPSKALTDSLNGMSVKIPYSRPERVIPGSLEDEHRDPHKRGRDTQIISARRTKRA